MRKVLLSTILLAGISAAAYSFTRSASAAPSGGNFEENELLSTENEPFALSIRQSRLRIEIASEHKSGTLSMYDLLGNKVFEFPANESIEYSVANLKSGLYFIVLKGGKTNFTRKFLHKQEG